MIRVLFTVLVIAMAGISAYAEDEKPGGDDFLSSSLSMVFDKVGKYTSGEKSILYSESDLRKEEEAREAKGKRIPRPNIKSGTASSADKSL